MRRARAFTSFTWDFVVGEDPLLFLLVCSSLGATALAQALGVASWWLLPLGVLVALSISVLRARSTT